MSSAAPLHHPASAWSSQSNLQPDQAGPPEGPLSPSTSRAAYHSYPPAPLSLPSPTSAADAAQHATTPGPALTNATSDNAEVEKDILGGEVGLKGLFVSPIVNCFSHPTRYLQPWLAVLAFGVIIIGLAVSHQQSQWYWLPMYALLLLLLSPYTRDPAAFFAGSLRSTSKASYSYVFLTASSFTAWLFAKSVSNASTLGYSYGLLGGLAYAGYYFGFWTTAVVVYQLRRLGYRSFMEAIYDKYGWYASLSFCLALLYRLNNEIWSNLVVVGSFYGTAQDANWWTAVAIAAAIPALYIIIGGVKSSMITDLFQGCFVVVYLIIVLAVIVPRAPLPFNHGISWTLKGGGDQLIVSILQGVLSYPFMDPAMTDRAFLGNRKAMIFAFFTGGTMAMVFITLFSFVGIYGKQIGLTSGAPAVVTGHIGTAAFAACSLISVSDSIATMDNTFSALAKLAGVEIYSLFKEWRPRTVFTASKLNMYIGRLSIVVFCIAGVLPLLANPTALSATTVTGTVVMGLGPSIWLLIVQKGPSQGAHRHPWAFLLPFWFGVFIGSVYQGDGSEAGKKLLFWSIGDGNNKILLGTNLYGAIISWGLFFIGWVLPWPKLFDQALPKPSPVTAGEGRELEDVKTVGQQDVQARGFDAAAKVADGGQYDKPAADKVARGEEEEEKTNEDVARRTDTEASEAAPSGVVVVHGGEGEKEEFGY